MSSSLPERIEGNMKSSSPKKVILKRKKTTSKSASLSSLHLPPFNLFSDSVDDRSKTFDDGLNSIVKILKEKKNIVVLVGAGISVSCGIPDFRSKGTGIYHTMDANELGLSTPEELFHLECFQDDPRPFYKFATKMLYPIKPIDPSPSHRFLALLEQKKLLLRVYTQNIDGLEEKAGVSSKKIVYAHGTLSTSTCLKCGHKVSADLLREDILKGDIPYCRRIINKSRKRKRKEDKEANNQSSDCGTNEVVVSSLSIMPRRARLSPTNNSCESQSYDEDKNIRTCGGVMKPNITFFGEQLIDRVRKCLEADRKKADAVIVIGTSLSVAPMSKIIEYLSPSIPRILINQNIVIPKHGSYCEDGRKRSDVEIDYHDEDNNYVKDHRSDFVFDACLLGFCDEVTTSLFALMSESNEDNKSKLRSLSSAQEDCCNFRVLCNIPSLVERLKVQTLFRHPLDRIFLYPCAILSKYDDDKNDDDESKEIKFQEIVHCDGCHQVIKKVIMKCTDCFDFDLCQDCFVTISKVHFEGNHKFIAEE